MPTVSASVARQSLPAQLDRVEAGEEVSITRHGHVVAVLVRPDILATRRAQRAWDIADRVSETLFDAKKRPLPKKMIGTARADELVSQVRNERTGR